MKPLLLALLLSTPGVYATKVSSGIGISTASISMHPAQASTITHANVCAEDRYPCREFRTELVLFFTARGCADHVTPVIWEIVGNVVVVSAWNMNSKLSAILECPSKPVFEDRIVLPLLPPFEVHFLGTDAVVQIPKT